jgi:VCBS repeat-containing protein
VASPIRGISFTDVDAGNGNVTVTFTVPRGTLSATSAGSVTVSGGPASITLVGTIANINTFLAQDRLLYTTVLNDTADVSLAVAIDDGGNSGLDPGLTGTATSEADAETFTITVIAVNDAPVAQDGTASGNEDTPISGTLTATDVDSASLTYALVTNAAHGTVTVHADGTFTYVPAADYNGSDSFTFKANDGEADSNVATIGLTINPVDDPIAGPRTDPGIPPRLFDLAGVGTPGPHGGTWATPGVSDGFFVVATGDFNGDGTDDVLWRDASGRIDEWSMQNESWATSIYLGARGTDWQVAGTGDFNGDGTSDVLWRNTTTGQLDTWIMQNGQWSKSIGLGTHGTDWKVLGTGDFNGDGTDDILFQNTKTGAVDGWQMANGNWSKSLAIGGARDLAFSQVAIGDFDGDGTSDVLWRNPTTGAVDEWHIKDGNWAGSIDLGTFNTGYELAGVDDFNGSGTADILWRNPTTGQVDGWVMHNGQWFASVSLGSFDPAYRLAGAGDFDHAGGADVLWHNAATGETGTWLLHAI